jgi:hypothetical protein
VRDMRDAEVVGSTPPWQTAGSKQPVYPLRELVCCVCAPTVYRLLLPERGAYYGARSAEPAAACHACLPSQLQLYRLLLPERGACRRLPTVATTTIPAAGWGQAGGLRAGGGGGVPGTRGVRGARGGGGGAAPGA